MPVIRNFSLEDAPALREIYLNTRRTTFNWVPEAKFKLEDFEPHTQGEIIYVAQMNTVLLGFVSIWAQENFIHHLYIDPKYQGEKVGDKLLGFALQTMGRPARLKCAIQNTRACKFYEKRNWKIESKSEVGELGPYYTFVLRD
ncbi:MAG: GNAT family N-acetyltransferase [Bdellovibrionota bacterium]